MSIPYVAVAGVRSFSVAAMLGLIVLAGGWPGGCRAEAGADDLTGRVVDRAGAGVADLRIWAIGGSWEHPRVVARAKTGAEGRFVLPRPAEPSGSEDAGFHNILALADDGRLGWRFTGWPKYPQRDELRIVLRPVGEVRARLNDQDGRPIAGAEITPAAIYLKSEDHPGQDYLPMPAELAGPLRATTAADGSFAIKGLPQGAQIQATVAAPGLGGLQVLWKTDRPATIVLDRRSGRIEGTLKPPDARGLSGKLTLSIRRPSPPVDGDPEPFRVLASRTETADPQGHFRFADLPPGTYEIAPVFERGTPFTADPVGNIQVGPNAVARVEVPLRGHVRITGRVVDARTGRGIPEVMVRSWAVDPQMSIRQVDQTETNVIGRYTIGAPPGRVQISLFPVPTDYLAPRETQNLRLDVDGDRAWPDIKLDPAVAVDGVVVDEAGKPVAGATVFAMPAPRGLGMGERATTTGPDGTFHFDQIDPDDSLPLRARTREATTDGAIVIRPGALKGRLRLTIDPKFAFRIRGRVTDKSGRRLEGTKAVLWWQRSYVSGKLQLAGMGIGSALDTETTDESGWFVFRALWPGDRYKVAIDAEGYGKAEPPEVQGRAGETHDLGTIALTGGAGHIAGRVVGSDGKPIAGATVFNRGDAPTVLTTRTGGDGRFRLDNLFPGARYAFVRKDGYRFTGAKVDGDADDLAITLLKTAEPPPAWKPAAGPSFADQRDFARQMLIRVWEKFGGDAEQNGASGLIPVMARDDLELALQWSAERGHRFDSQARRAAAEALAETDAPGALELLGLVEGNDRRRALQHLAERFATSDPRKALAFAEEAAVQGRALPQPDRTYALAQASEVLVRLGRAEAGRKLIDEVAGDAQRLTSGPMDGYSRGSAARALAPYDLDRALKLIEPFTEPREKTRYISFVADGIAASDPDRAAALADEASPVNLSAAEVRTRIAVRLGPEDPERAIRFIEGMKGHFADKYQAEGFAWLAAAVAPRDKARAAALIDRALSLPVDRPEAFRSWMNSGGAPTVAARVAVAARLAGYPDMDSVLMRVMAARPSPDDGFHDPATNVKLAATAAVPLALADPGAARVLLEQIEARGGLDSARIAEVAGFDWLGAWSLVDLDKAESLVDAQLAALEKTRGARLRVSGLFGTLDLLLTPPERREAAVLHIEGPPWRPVFQH
jgi:hypothetical protein